ncbi:uncharacterized protein AMSG_06413 [Thecamonas trahens ATCC 50062]|uniref:Uncharacterized protein n=1 Tax=Thecamonas trahens ATCC 50062 TaxID=461836 RepID=A0A0L0DDQ2_THETB|nr:hypothetical protein AMSG_06413 [Thecamonas trahens ATCC 50062]KNC50256.1 hypothetical protein AMSG_06413 [Thecamonas trahens ATCC 50062]|eukprot:XP_013757085.1 hypothetical protein AMSG_06413 [Thecamonas trahens ATCC 50062]
MPRAMRVVPSATLALALTLVVALALAVASPTAAARPSTPPVLPPTYSVEMHEYLHTAVPDKEYRWNISYAISYELGSARQIHSAGQYDEICSSIPGHEHTGERCEVIINTDYRYVYLPDSDICCQCCTSGAPQYCGVVKPDWAANGTYIGEVPIDTGGPSPTTCYQYDVQGHYVNHFYVTPELAPDGYVTPCEFWEAKPGHVLRKQFVYQLATYSTAPIPASHFDLPDVPGGCDQQCPGICEHAA